MQIVFMMFTILLFLVLAMSLAAFGVHLSRSIREFRAGYEGRDSYFTV
ncbi:hypothetical protein [Rothia nasimurium]|nr:hypothetical protein [Rothia nasimurium]